MRARLFVFFFSFSFLSFSFSVRVPRSVPRVLLQFITLDDAELASHVLDSNNKAAHDALAKKEKSEKKHKKDKTQKKEKKHKKDKHKARAKTFSFFYAVV